MSARFGGIANGPVLAGVPLGLAWAAPAMRMEGRAPWRAGLGWLQLFVSPRDGTRLGRPDRAGRPVRYRGRTWVTELDDRGQR